MHTQSKFSQFPFNSSHLRRQLNAILLLSACLAVGCGSTSRIASISAMSTSSAIAVSGTAQFSATATGTQGNILQRITFTWTSSAPAVASIDAGTGEVTGLLPGTTQVTAFADGVTSSPLTFTVTPGFLLISALNTPRAGPTATQLNNGMVLLAGGNNTGIASGSTASAELYNPATGTFIPTGNMNVGHNLHTATLLNTGMVLIAGGITTNDAPIAAAELYDPATGTFTLTGSMNTPRYLHTSILLPSGKVLLASGVANNTAELYDPTTGTFQLTGSLNVERDAFASALLNDGRVLVVGGLGTSGYLSSAELYDPATGLFTLTGSMNAPRDLFSATLLNNGMVLVAGGVSNSQTSSGAELYDPATGLFTATGSLNNGRFRYSATLLTNGTVLLAGGDMSSVGIGSSSELYDPSSRSFTFTGSLNIPRGSQAATLLNNGNALIAGGIDPQTQVPERGEELYEPGAFTPPGLQSIAVSPGVSTLTAGATQRFVATGSFAGGAQQLAAVIWSSSNPSLVQISNDKTNSGTALVVASPTSSTNVTITAAVGAVSGSATITVGP